MSFPTLSPFSFSLPTQISFGEGLSAQAGKQIAALIPGNRAMIVTDPGIIQAGLLDAVLSGLQEQGYLTEVFTQVAPNPKDTDCLLGAQAARDFAPDVIVAVGGGSVIDSAKVIALLHTHPGTVQDYEGRDRITGEVTPLVIIPTTAGTGSEVTRSAVITDTSRKFKMTVKDRKLAPRLAIVDPATTYSLPRSLTAATGMDAFVHAIEAFTCKVANPLSDALAEAAMRRIWRALPTAVHQGESKEARHEMMVGSLMAGIAFSHADVAAVHCMAEALGGLYDTPHGVANSIFLPVVTAFNAEADPIKHARVAEICGLASPGQSPEEAAKLLVDALFRLSDHIGIPRFASLSYVKQEDFPALAEASFRNGSTPNNCRTVSTEEYLGLFRKAFEGSRG